VGWGEVINGGFGMLLDGSDDADRKLKNMLYFDVTNGIARRAWARNDHAVATVTRALKNQPDLSVTLPNEVSGTLLDNLIP
jgi:urocanate hydratase